MTFGNKKNRMLRDLELDYNSHSRIMSNELVHSKYVFPLITGCEILAFYPQKLIRRVVGCPFGGHAATRLFHLFKIILICLFYLLIISFLYEFI